MSTTESAAYNGVNVQSLLDARTALTVAPEAAEFTWLSTNELLRGTPSETVVPSTIDEPAVWWSSGLSALEIQRLVAEYEFARARIDPSGKPYESDAPQSSSRLK